MCERLEQQSSRAYRAKGQYVPAPTRHLEERKELNEKGEPLTRSETRKRPTLRIGRWTAWAIR
jgi:hypothetical protein